MISHADCFDEVFWFEAGVESDTILGDTTHNLTLPVVGEVRSIRIGHRHQEPVGSKMWLLFQSGLSLANGFPEPEAELENASIIEVEILEQSPLSKRKDYYDPVEYLARVRCLRVIAFTQITQQFEPSPPCPPWQWPDRPAEIQLFETPSFTYVWLVTQESREWFVLTKAQPVRLIAQCFALRDEPFTVCNCVWNWNDWPHKIRSIST